MMTALTVAVVGDTLQVSLHGDEVVAVLGVGPETRGRQASVSVVVAGSIKHEARISLADEKARSKWTARVSALTGRQSEEYEGALLALLTAVRKKEAGRTDGDDEATTAKAEILDTAPDLMTRPLCRVAGRAYAAAWVHLNAAKGSQLVIVRDDGRVFCETPLMNGSKPLVDLGFDVHLTLPVNPRNGWSGRGVKRFAEGERPDPADVFRRLKAYFDHHLKFVRSLGDQDSMVSLLAVYAIYTFMLDAFSVAGYCWFQGQAGSGKTWALKAMSLVSFLGEQLLAATTLPNLRDLSDYGGLIGLDDAENVTDDDFDPDKRALLLSGNQRGMQIMVKEPAPSGKTWVPRHVNIFGPRLFSSIRTPDATLASRCILIPMCRADEELPDPADFEQWPAPRAQLIDDLWALALSNMMAVRAEEQGIKAHTALMGRALQPWRGVLTIARWLDHTCGIAGVFETLTSLSQAYQGEVSEFEADNPIRLILHCLDDMLEEHPAGASFEFKTSELATRINAEAKVRDLSEEGKEFMSSKRLGRVLRSLRFQRPRNLPGPKRWKVSRAFWNEVARPYGVLGPAESPADAVLDGIAEVFS